MAEPSSSKAASNPAADLTGLPQQLHAQLWHRLALVTLVMLILLCLAWELWLAPVHPGGSWVALKIIPLLLPLRGVFKRDIYTMQWSSMLIMLFFIEGVVRAFSDLNPLSARLAQAETGLVLLYFFACILYLRPYKRAAKAAARAALERASASAKAAHE